MFYEGTEKRLLIAVKSINLLTLDDFFWQQLVAQSGAAILSTVNNGYIKAYLLSESSLFIWKDKLLLITCGNTQLVKAAIFMQQQWHKTEICTLLFQRHQALKPQLQHSNFHQDSLLLTQQFEGQQQHWQGNYQGDLFVFGDISSKRVTTRNIYMLHGLSGDFAIQLQAPNICKNEVLEKLALHTFFTGLLIDHFSFNPKGYSLNAICGEDYLAIHLTPESLSTYLSIETSFNNVQCQGFISHLKLLFSPKRVNTMSFQPVAAQLNITVL